MNYSDFNYRKKTADCYTLTAHLTACADCFDPPLHTYVDISKYAEKIFEKAITFEMWDGELLIGLIAAYFNDKTTRRGFITNVSVLDYFYGRGIATFLLNEVVKYGVQNSFRQIDLELNKNNLAAFRLYKKNGFAITQTNEQIYVMSRNLWGDCCGTSIHEQLEAS
jgi:ribosomal protein S18 acetylase RimI-like enzyme